ncbi:MAG: penicillin acylase family protein [Longimicrobiales bacterium]|nr:penicillin acylase family protein [Longimicrobiales bacterium]
MRRSIVVVLSFVLLLALAASLALTRVRNGPGLPGGTTEVSGLSAPVEVLWDSAAVPHIFAASIEDAYFAQGMVHARHRLWQIELFRRVATGRLAEVLGAPALSSDRFLRTLGVHRVAARAAALLDPETRRLVQAYVDGLNHQIATWRGPLPPEFLVLRFRPEPFTIEDALAIERIMAWDLTAYGGDLSEAAALAELGAEAFERIRPRDPPGGTTIVGGERGLAFPTRDRATDGSAGAAGPRGAAFDARGGAAGPQRAALLRSAAIPHALVPLLEAVNAVRASNGWVVGGERSASGMPLVANDMHLGLDRPTLFYLVGLHAPGLDAVGMSIPGAPSIVAGRGGGVAWGYTNANVDDADFFVERVDPADSTRYLTPEGSEPFERRVEVIRVSGREHPDTLVVRHTRHGPIMTPVEARLDGELVALRWVAHSDSSTIPSVLAMARAPDVDAFLDALKGFRTLHQNVVFADTAGGWGYWMAGRVPLRGGGARPPVAPTPGWTGELEWEGFLPFEAHPHALAPEQGFVATANNRQATDSIGDLISSGAWAYPYRAERITRLLEARADHDVTSMHEVQLDVVTLRGFRHREVAAEGFRAAGAPAIADSLAAWDGSTAVDRVQPRWFTEWFAGVRRALAREVWGTGGGAVWSSAVERWIDGGLPDGVSEAAAREAIAVIETNDASGGNDAVSRDATWGEVHTLHLDHPLASVPILQRLFGFARSGIPVPGTGNTVRAASSSRTPDGRYRVTHGASQRHVSDMADDVAWFVLPGGQSGYPGGPHSADQLRMWLEGGLLPLPLDRAGVEARTVRAWRLVPGG